MKIALLGIRGVPAKYGGFETCVEEVGARLAAAGHRVVVYCRPSQPDGRSARVAVYRGMDLVYLPALRRRSLETLSHTALSVAHLLLRHGDSDVAVLFNAANSPFARLFSLRRIPVATHVDGLEWRRAKWGRLGKRYYRLAESLAVRWSDALIADAAGIREYYEDEFGAPSELLRYGAPIIADSDPTLLERVGLSAARYHLVVARLEPENHVDVIVNGYARSMARDPLVVVGSTPYSGEYATRVRDLGDERVRFLGAVWDQQLLNALYSNALSYFHGHSVGGTNPSLLRAIGAGTATNAFDVRFNREVLGEEGRYWSSAADVTHLVESTESDRDATLARGERSRALGRLYDWDEVAAGYEDLCRKLHSREVKRSSASGRRRSPGWQG